MSKLEIAKFKDGSVLKINEAGTHASIMVIEEAEVFNNGYYSTAKRCAFLRGEKKLMEQLGAKEGADLNSLTNVTLKIIRRESTAPFYEGQKHKINPSDDSPVLTAEGEHIYFEDVLVPAGSDEGDTFVSSAKVEAAAEAGAVE